MGSFAKKMNKAKRINAVGKSMEQMYHHMINNMDYLKKSHDEMRLIVGFQQKMIDKLLGKEYCEDEFEVYKADILKQIAEEEAKKKAAESGEKGVNCDNNCDIVPQSVEIPVKSDEIRPESPMLV